MTRLVPVQGLIENNYTLMVDAINAALKGKLNSTGTFSPTDSVTTTVITNTFLSPDSLVFFDPMTAAAATELYGGTMYVLTANRGTGTWTVTHTSDTSTRTFKYIILG